MGLKDITRDGILKAIAEAQAVGEPAFRTKGGFDPSNKFPLLIGTERYSSKAIIGAAHGYDRPDLGPLTSASKELSGGMQPRQAGGILKAHDFPIAAPAPPALHAALAEVLGHLPAAFDEPFTDHSLGDALVRRTRTVVEQTIDDPGYKVKGSRGQSIWAQTVWLGVFDLLVTDSAQRGYYVVYLFRGDGAGVFLSLNQGTTAVKERYGARYRRILSDRATVYAELIGKDALTDLQHGPIELVGNSDLTRGYQDGNIAARYYDNTALPDDASLVADLERFLSLYRQLVEAKDHSKAEDELDVAVDGPHGSEQALEATRLRWHLRAERNPQLAVKAKKIHGSACKICGFEYKDRYGALGSGYIEAHHVTPFSELKGRPTNLDARKDFTVLCANCHRMVHQRRPPYDLADVKDALI